MAINKAVENEYGAEFTYHKLREVRLVNDEKIGIQLVMTVYSWINKQARIDGKEPTVRQCIIHGADFALTPFYTLLKAKFPEFTDGANDFNNDSPVGGWYHSCITQQTDLGRKICKHYEPLGWKYVDVEL